MRLSWGSVASIDLPAGYGTVAREMRLALAAAGAEIVPDTCFDYDRAVVVGLPVAWIAGGHRPDMIWHTMIEVYPIPPGWADVMNHASAVWVPSTWVRDLFRESGVRAPIMVAGYGIDPDVFRPVDRAGRSGPLKVLAWGRGLMSRKNLAMAVRVFAAANLRGAHLEVKVNADDLLVTDGMGVNGRDDVRFIAQNWSTGQVARWLQSGDVLLYLSSGEGFGLMPLEAMSTGLPVVCAYNTGMMDYLSDDVAYLVPCEPAPVPSYRKYFGYDLQGYQPNFEAAVAQLQRAARHPEQAYEIGQRAAAMAAGMTWEQAGRRALHELQQLHNGGIDDGRHFCQHSG